MQPNLACSGPGRTGFIDFRVAPAVHASSSRELLGRARAADAGRSCRGLLHLRAQPHVWKLLRSGTPEKVPAVDHTPVFSRGENAIAKEPGSSYHERWPLAVCVCARRFTGGLGSLGAFPESHSEQGSAFGLIIGDPDP